MTKEELEEVKAYIASKPEVMLSLEEASPSLLCSEGGVVTEIPLCNVCKNCTAPDKCRQLGDSPDAYSYADKRDCEYAVLATDSLGFQTFAELYPEDTERLLHREPKTITRP